MADSGAFLPIHPNPFIVGNPVRGRSMFFGREAEFELVRKRFQGSSRGGLMVFCGERRSGKTSILFQILDGRLGPSFIPVLIDMQSMAVTNEMEFFTRISDEVRSAVGSSGEPVPLPSFPSSGSHSAAFQKFVHDILAKHPGKNLILLFDEYELFENKIDGGMLSSDALHVLASLMENHPVFLIFTGSQHLEQRRQEYWKILGKSLHKMISFLERDDALNLIRKPVEGRVRYDEDTVDHIWRLTAGQPFYTQAICQSLVAQLNERHSNEATADVLHQVVDGIVNNPLPQMIFLWDGLERDEKLVLALLAERLESSAAFGGADDLTRLRRKRQYPIELQHARVATTLEKLFQSEMLLRSDRGSAHTYAFRMDLWRQWIRRQHSVWQVMREEGLEIRGKSKWKFTWVAAIPLAGAIAWIAVHPLDRKARREPVSNGTPAADAASTASLALETDPTSAAIYLRGEQVAVGAFHQALATGQDHRFRLAAAGYADTEIVVRVQPSEAASRRVRLRELFADLRVVTDPPQAAVMVDGQAIGRSPVSGRGMS